MKTKFFLAAMIVLVSTSAFSQAAGPRAAVINQQGTAIFKVIYAGEKEGRVTMTIFDKKSKVVFSEITNNVDGFIRKVNFSGMQYGEYTIELADQSGKLVQPIVYSRISNVKNVQVSKIGDKSKYVLNVTNTGSEKISVRIYDGSNNLVHTEYRTIDGNFGLVYNLASVQGLPTFEVSDDEGNVRTIKY